MKAQYRDRMVRCSWCGTITYMGDGDASEATHTLCPACAVETNRQLDEMEKEAKRVPQRVS